MQGDPCFVLYSTRLMRISISQWRTAQSTRNETKERLLLSLTGVLAACRNARNAIMEYIVGHRAWTPMGHYTPLLSACKRLQVVEPLWNVQLWEFAMRRTANRTRSTPTHSRPTDQDEPSGVPCLMEYHRLLHLARSSDSSGDEASNERHMIVEDHEAAKELCIKTFLDMGIECPEIWHAGGRLVMRSRAASRGPTGQGSQGGSSTAGQ